MLDIKDRLECGYRRQATVDHRLTRELTCQASPIDLGGKSFTDVLSTRLRISKDEARRRLQEAEDLAPRTALGGQPLEPRLPNTAAAQARGDIGAEHVRIIRKFFAGLPAHIDYESRSLAKADLARVAAGFTPEELRKAADRLSALLDPDGAEPDDTERARKRSFHIGPQQADGMSPFHGLLDPQARATLDPVLAKWAAPGMCNPADQAPCVDGTPSQDHIDNDQRSQAQRNHDALTAIARAMLASGQLGQHNGLPVTIIVSTTLQELESAAGHAVTAGGTLLPMSEVIRLAAHAHHYLVVYDKHTGQTLYLEHSKRIASPGQRIVLHAKDRGCTAPGMRGARLRLSGPPRRTGLGQGREADQHRRPHLRLRPPTTDWSPNTAGGPENEKTGAPNGFRHHPWTPDNPASTTTTTRRNTYCPKTIRPQPKTTTRPQPDMTAGGSPCPTSAGHFQSTRSRRDSWVRAGPCQGRAMNRGRVARRYW